MQRKWRIFLVIVLPLILVFFYNQLASASNGELNINNQVIYGETQKKTKQAVTYTINQLFMAEMTEKAQQVTQDQLRLVADAKESIFSPTPSQRPTYNQQITPTLFSKDYALTDSGVVEGRPLESKSVGNLWLLFLVGGLVALALGILLGRKFPTWLKKS